MSKITFSGRFPTDFNYSMEGFQGGGDFSFSMTSTEAIWHVDGSLDETIHSSTMRIEGTDLDTNHGKITSINFSLGGVAGGQTQITGISADFNLFREGMDTQDWTKIGAALQGIGLTGSANGYYNVFQGLGGDDDIKLPSNGDSTDSLYFDGGNDRVVLGTGYDEVYAVSLNYVPAYETLRWEVIGRDASLYLWQDPSSSSEGKKVINIATKGFDITLGKESTFLDGTALFKGFVYVSGTPFGDKITGDASSNILRGLGGNDVLDGGGSASALLDSLYGDAGDDTLIIRSNTEASGGDGFDTVLSYVNVDGKLLDTVERIVLAGSKALDASLGRDDDAIVGNSAANRLEGHGGNDSLNGGDGNDRLYGDDGNDRLLGGKGKDELRGGAGADAFVLNATAGSTVAAAHRDTVHDFIRQEGDTIDLQLMDANAKRAGDQHFTFIGSHAFHHKAGELRYDISDGATFVLGDVNGDGEADFALKVDGKIHFQDSDFSL